MSDDKKIARVLADDKHLEIDRFVCRGSLVFVFASIPTFEPWLRHIKPLDTTGSAAECDINALNAAKS